MKTSRFTELFKKIFTWVGGLLTPFIIGVFGLFGFYGSIIYILINISGGTFSVVKSFIVVLIGACSFSVYLELGKMQEVYRKFNTTESFFSIFHINKKLIRFLSIISWALFFVCMGLTFYVNHYLPHGPYIDTGDVACEYDGKGSCSELYVEDMRQLGIPNWAKFLRKNFVGVLGGLLFLGWYLNWKSEDHDAQ